MSSQHEIELIRQLLSPSAETRLSALHMLASSDPVLYVVAARAAITDADEVIRCEACTALGNERRGGSAPLLVALRDSRWTVRSAAADALACRSAKSALRPLLRVARLDSHPAVRRDAALAAARIDPTCRSEMQQIVSGEKDKVALAGMYAALYEAGSDQGLGQLLLLLSDENDLVRDNAVNIIRSLGLRPVHFELVRGHLKLMIDDANPGVAGDAAITLGELGSG